MRHWRGRGLKAIVYLDDGIIAVKGEQSLQIEMCGSNMSCKVQGYDTHKNPSGHHQEAWNGWALSQT